MAEIDFDTIDWAEQQHLLVEENSDIMERAWRAPIGNRWAERNPTTVEATDLSFITRYGMTKSWLVGDALRAVPADSSWLEVGCSGGAHMRMLQSLGHPRVVGVDVNLEGMSEAPEGRVAQARARHLPFIDGAVDGIATSGTLIHLGPPDRLRASLHEFARVSRRWLFFIELWSAQPVILAFGNLLPPAWTMPWEESIPKVLPEWEIRHSSVHHHAMADGYDASSIGMLLMERRQ